MPDFDGDSQLPEDEAPDQEDEDAFWAAAGEDGQPADNDFESDDAEDFVMDEGAEIAAADDFVMEQGAETAGADDFVAGAETAEMAEPEVEAEPAELTVEEATGALLETAEIEVQDSQGKDEEVVTRPVARPLSREFKGAYCQDVAVIDSDDDQASGSNPVPLQSTSAIVADESLSKEEKIEKLRDLLSQLQSLHDRASTSAAEVASTVAEVRESLSYFSFMWFLQSSFKNPSPWQAGFSFWL